MDFSEKAEILTLGAEIMSRITQRYRAKEFLRQLDRSTFTELDVHVIQTGKGALIGDASATWLTISILREDLDE